MDRSFYEKTGAILSHCQEASVKMFETVRKAKITSHHCDVDKKNRFLEITSHLTSRTRSLCTSLDAMKNTDNFWNYQDGKCAYLLKIDSIFY